MRRAVTLSELLVIHHDSSTHGNEIAPTTRTVFVLEYALAHIRDDLHVSMSVPRKAAVRGDLVVVPDHEVPEPRVGGVTLAVECKVVPGFEPVVMFTSQGVHSSKLQHRSL